MKKRLTWITLGLLAALGVGVLAAPPIDLRPVYLWFGAEKVSAENPLPMGIFDDNGQQITTFSGGVQYTEGADVSTDPSGNLMMFRDGSGNAAPVSAGAALPVNVTTGTVTASGTVTAVTAGDVSHDSADSGNPVKIGGVFKNPGPTNVTSGDRTELRTNERGTLYVAITGRNGSNTDDVPLYLANPSVDTIATNTNVLPFQALGYSFGGSTWERNISCNSSAIVNVSAGSTTELVALSGSTQVRICAFTISGDTAATTAQFVSGTGTNCGTGTTNLTGAMRMQDEGNISNSAAGGGYLLKATAGHAVCLTAATGAVTGFISYVRF